MPDVWWWGAWAAVVLLLVVLYVSWLAGRVGRLHRRAEAATAALDAALVRRAAAAALLADELAPAAPAPAAGLSAAARAAIEAAPDGREAAENDLTGALRRLPPRGPDPVPAWAGVVTASRRLGLARQVHTDVVRDALAVRRRVPVRLLGLARRHPAPSYFDVGDPVLDEAADPHRPTVPTRPDQATRA
ncbi:MAG: hypothetical protein GEV12_17990 [Micromonosporaceae bacterium]|nr:hypothetical protein [Micromonosporaceae bacterium]